jgi:hypothetical protein
MKRIFLILLLLVSHAYGDIQNCHEMFVFPGDDLNTILQKKRDAENNCVCFDTEASAVKFGDESAVSIKKWLVTGVTSASQSCDSVCSSTHCP